MNGSPLPVCGELPKTRFELEVQPAREEKEGTLKESRNGSWG
jgi:hypothetical protein